MAKITDAIWTKFN